MRPFRFRTVNSCARPRRHTTLYLAFTSAVLSDQQGKFEAAGLFHVTVKTLDALAYEATLHRHNGVVTRIARALRACQPAVRRVHPIGFRNLGCRRYYGADVPVSLPTMTWHKIETSVQKCVEVLQWARVVWARLLDPEKETAPSHALLMKVCCVACGACVSVYRW